MLVWVQAMNQLPLEALEQIYSESLHSNANNRSYQSALDAFLEYLRMDFFPEGGSFCLWKIEDVFVSAARFLPYKDGLLLAGLETAPQHRKQGNAVSLLQEALRCIDSSPTPIYSHVHTENRISLRLHEACGFSVLYHHARLLDGTVSSRYYTLLRSS